MVYESDSINSLRDEVVYKKGNKIYIDEKWLYKKYVEENLSTQQISKLINVNRNVISRNINEYNIKRMEIYKNKDWLYQKYVIEGLSTLEISKMTNVNRQTISNWLYKYGIKIRQKTCLPDPNVNEEFV